jgi:alkylated DNA repair protein alkB family protein 1
MQSLDPHQRPPHGIRNVYKKYQKMKLKDLDQDADILDSEGAALDIKRSGVNIIKRIQPKQLNIAFQLFANDNSFQQFTSEVPVYEHEEMPGR